MTDVSPQQIANGLNELVNHPGDWPPNAVKFRQLCLGQYLDADGNDSSWQHKGEAYKLWNPEKRIESDEYKNKRQKAGDKALSDMKAMLGMK